MAMAATIVVAYDGSEDARRAVEVAAELVTAREAVLVHVHLEPPPPMIGADPAGDVEDAPGDHIQRQARRIAEEGAELARSAGFEAEPLLKLADTMTGVWRSIIAVAEERDAAAIVVGHRGMSRLESALLGSVANGIVNHASVPVLVVPAPRA
jgi:nucleotide-binding universal stress UspA family protein